MSWLIAALCAIAALYQVVAILACIWHKRRRVPLPSGALPPLSILKPIRGVTADLHAAIRSHLDQDYPDFELLLGVREDEAPIEVADPRTRVIVCRTVAPNRKVGTLMDLSREARHGILIVNDADIVVPAGYLRDIAVELAMSDIGLVTCLYRARSSTWAGRWEALGVATDFAPSALVAPFVGVSEFGLGSTLAFRREDLSRIGGFAVIAAYLADDYQLGRRLHALGRRNVIAAPVVSTSLNAPAWGAVWRHQVRWSRTVRLSRTGGYIGLPVTFATLWVVVAALNGLPWIALALLCLRLAMAATAGYWVLGSLDALRYLYLVPFRDLYSVVVWAAALYGNTVEWGGETLTLTSDGRIVTSRGGASG